MVLSDVKAYLQTRINASDLLSESDQNLTKYMATANNLLSTFYHIENLSDENLSTVVGEEMLFLFNSNIDLNLFYQYEGLTSFNIGNGAIQGSVDYKNKGDFFSAYVKSILESLGIEEKIDQPNSKVRNGYTWL